jgi:hypothetical protein
MDLIFFTDTTVVSHRSRMIHNTDTHENETSSASKHATRTLVSIPSELLRRLRIRLGSTLF